MAYSKDLRIRAVNHFLGTNQSYKSGAELFQIGTGTFHRWVKRYRDTGDITPHKSTGRPRCLDSTTEINLKEFVLQHPDETLSSLSEKWQERTGVLLSRFCISRTLRRTGLSFKKKPFVHQNATMRHIVRN
jgi:transposase